MTIVQTIKTNASDWLVRVRRMSAAASEASITHDLGTVEHRIERDSARERAIEAGCAYRVLRMATAARRAGHNDLALGAHALAAEIIRVELYPDPDWSTMCEEEGWPL